MAPTDYLKRRGHTWYVRVQIPSNLWKAAGGKREYVKTLETGDLGEANKRKPPYVALFKRRVELLARTEPGELDALYEKALAWRDAFERHKGQVIYEEQDGTPYYLNDEFLSQLSDEAKEYLEAHGEKAADAFYAIAKGEKTPLKPQVEPWLTDEAATVTGQTVSQHRTVLTAFLAWAGDVIAIEDITRKKAGEYVDHLLAPQSRLSRRTVKRYVSSLSSLWTRLEARGFVTVNPWLNQKISKKSKRGDAGTERKQWTDDALVKVLTGRHTPRYTQTLHDLVKLALVTGARMDEICSLKPNDVQRRSDGWWISITQGKSKAAVRDIPVFDGAAHILLRRKRHARTYLFDELIPGGPDNKRSWNVSKAFGHYTNKLELGDKRQVFHDLRRTFAETLEAVEVPESTAKLIMGHASTSMTYGHYSTGQRVQLRTAIDKLHYSNSVMKLIRATTDEKTEHQGKSKAGKKLKRKNAGA